MTPIVEFGPVDENVREQMRACLAPEDGALGVLCADNHLGFSMPIGGVVAYWGLISPSAVGFDVGCGNAAIRLDVKAADLPIATIMDDVWRVISFGMGRKNAERVEHPILDEIAECAHPFQKDLAQTAAQQIGTVGSGNHYVDIFEDEEGWTWIGVHFGSRGFGHKTATWALQQLGATSNDMHAPPAVIPVWSALGADYLDGMERALRYAYAGREWVVDRVRQIIGGRETARVHNHHNAAWRESHGGRSLYVHRKGATPAAPGQQGFVGATMGEPAVILEGVDSERSAAALYSTVHGAGRVMSRTKAAGKSRTATVWRCGMRDCSAVFPARQFNRGPNDSLPVCPTCGGKMHRRTETTRLSDGLIDWDAARADLAARGIELRGAGADEAPGAYKRLSEVLAYHGGTVNVLHTLSPRGVAMAGPDVVDPFRD